MLCRAENLDFNAPQSFIVGMLGRRQALLRRKSGSQGNWLERCQQVHHFVRNGGWHGH